MSDYSSDADSWLDWAEATYAGAQTLFLSDNSLAWFPAAILGHQALEMFLKATLLRKGRRIAKKDVWGHDLCALAHKLVNKGVALAPQFLEDLQKFADYFNELRYPTKLRSVSGLGKEEGFLLRALVQVLRPHARAYQ
jgi:HEPN domain-containing protein